MHDETQVMNDEDNANDEMTNGSRTRLFKLQQNIHDVLCIQHPDCVEPDGHCPTCESYELVVSGGYRQGL